MSQRIAAARVGVFTESVIREMTRLCLEYGGVNLAQGFPDFDPPAALLDAAARALREGYNQYAITWGSPRLRQAIAAKVAWYNGLEVDPEQHITVTCGATEAMMATLLALVDPGDEVVIFEPFYENYGPDAILAGATPRYVRLHLDDPQVAFDPGELTRAFSRRTRAIIVNTPHNPTGKVFTRAELELIADLCRHYGAVAVTDEVYEHLLYDGATHVSLAALPGMAERTVTINSVSKTYSVTGWRVGWAICRHPALTTGIRKAHDFLTVGAAAPLQEAAVTALAFPPTYYTDLAALYRRKRDRLLQILERYGFRCLPPRGAYYIMAAIDRFTPDDVAFAHTLVKEIGVAAVPGSSFFHEPSLGRGYVRFAFPKRDETLDEVDRRLARLPAAAGSLFR
ncbi:MAG: aminotransferase class I/II-fold pyridoxal phosphate-dependent enzyme [Armatimonadota bacterium]|nr:aminotransferase class I/II-fold pyridoxal phosphate-dependent enzyme [Armatimonadota bacterium]MDR7436619.1 aminotransferase class I/II-fold pyridoxal phosphate-dependent enzyme [Armatimonadota bacterium]MDR7472962.1 aminotransferase class I/II-fold pyridoxal phosphate-dependent enzyme [Armatimonadota bacterium]MDR7506630.1 aminotransferase class I/II-fold pyridoxal phosphate-dependent enzyme [Armatimonadota bacterium]MDR7509985.1 aminotransferase class I/II-fold pyridoxal phosphate-depende